MEYQKKALKSFLATIIAFVASKFICHFAEADGIKAFLWLAVVLGCSLAMIVTNIVFIVNLRKFLIYDICAENFGVGFAYAIYVFAWAKVLSKWPIDAPESLQLLILIAEILPLLIASVIAFINLIVAFVKGGGIGMMFKGIATAGIGIFALATGIAAAGMSSGSSGSGSGSNDSANKKDEDRIRALNSENEKLKKLKAEREKNYAKRNLGSEHAPKYIAEDKRKIERNNRELNYLNNKKK